jgi:hypothetical protein
MEDQSSIKEISQESQGQSARVEPLRGAVVKRPAISESKLKANRKNAKKSTGPRTARGKAYSRQNALKHAIFSRERNEFLAKEENPNEFHEFYGRLLDELQPVGPLEEFEVEHIAICWLKLQRLWRYENAEIEACRDKVARRAEEGFYDPLSRSTWRATIMSLLQTAQKEAETNGQVSQKLMGTIFAKSHILKFRWTRFQEEAEEIAHKKSDEIAAKIAEQRQMPLAEAEALLKADAKSVPEYLHFVAAETTRQAIRTTYKEWWRSSDSERDNDYTRRLVPDDSATDKIIRYGNAIEKQMDRAYDRLERLQRRRRGESVLPPVSVQLTQ